MVIAVVECRATYKSVLVLLVHLDAHRVVVVNVLILLIGLVFQRETRRRRLVPTVNVVVELIGELARFNKVLVDGQDTHSHVSVVLVLAEGLRQLEVLLLKLVAALDGECTVGAVAVA